MKAQLLIFIKNPEIGKCKTRLANSIGDINALEIYKILLDHTHFVSKNLNLDMAVYYSSKIVENDIWEASIYKKYEQEGEDLGLRMLNAFKRSFRDGYEKVVIIGSDLLDLKKEHLLKAFTNLETNDFVIGPATDGGYYLLGMKKLESSLFYNKEWGTNTVCRDSMKDLKGKKIASLEKLNDIDIYDDITKYSIFKSYLKKKKHELLRNH